MIVISAFQKNIISNILFAKEHVMCTVNYNFCIEKISRSIFIRIITRFQYF
jgi:hypothetical protein